MSGMKRHVELFAENVVRGLSYAVVFWSITGIVLLIAMQVVDEQGLVDAVARTLNAVAGLIETTTASASTAAWG